MGYGVAAGQGYRIDVFRTCIVAMDGGVPVPEQQEPVPFSPRPDLDKLALRMAAGKSFREQPHTGHMSRSMSVHELYSEVHHHGSDSGAGEGATEGGEDTCTPGEGSSGGDGGSGGFGNSAQRNSGATGSSSVQASSEQQAVGGGGGGGSSGGGGHGGSGGELPALRRASVLTLAHAHAQGPSSPGAAAAAVERSSSPFSGVGGGGGGGGGTGFATPQQPAGTEGMGTSEWRAVHARLRVEDELQRLLLVESEEGPHVRANAHKDGSDNSGPRERIGDPLRGIKPRTARARMH
ncbi:hypothetical protein FOA52_009126 [Chlamydomonas sp. UWO 241]|nr:hypothetical protein FOA52_009126 [Chlamydomonas sp. UWO 241]